MTVPQAFFLQQSLETTGNAGEFDAANARWSWVAQGGLRIEPHTDTGLCGVIISVGVHGDETVPIRLLDTWLARATEGRLNIRRPMLVLLGNPEAVVAGRRFVQHNMNRLFSSASEQDRASECQRAVVLMNVARDFARQHPEGLHFDMHSTIKPSDQDRFAVIPVDCKTMDLSGLHAWFRHFAVDAWVQNISPAAAFSSFTARLGYRSATLELGQVSALDEPIDRFLPLLAELDRLASGPASEADHTITGFHVIDEIIRPEGTFELCLEDFVNFRQWQKGTLIARSDDSEWRVQNDGDALLFLNADVPPGHRVALVIHRILRHR
jgi:succinylglutamate desuccinylase